MTLRIAIAGAGMVSRHHLIGWSRSDGAKVVAIADPSIDAAQRRAAEFAIARVHDDPNAMLDAGGIDALDIAAPLATHASLVEAAARRGLNVLCQKPLAPTAAEALEVAQLAEQHGVRLMVHENWRFRPHYRTIGRWLGEARIGTPAAFHLSLLGSGLLAAGDEPPPSLTRQPFLAKMPRMLVLEILIHHLDTLQFLFGPLEVTSARTARLSPHLIGEDTASISLAGKVGGTIFASMAAKGLPARGRDELTILGEEGRITLAGDRLSLVGARTETHAVDFEADYQASYDGTVEHFATALSAGTPFETPPDVHAAVLAQVEAIYALAAG